MILRSIDDSKFRDQLLSEALSDTVLFQQRAGVSTDGGQSQVLVFNNLDRIGLAGGGLSDLFNDLTLAEKLSTGAGALGAVGSVAAMLNPVGLSAMGAAGLLGLSGLGLTYGLKSKLPTAITSPLSKAASGALSGTKAVAKKLYEKGQIELGLTQEDLTKEIQAFQKLKGSDISPEEYQDLLKSFLSNKKNWENEKHVPDLNRLKIDDEKSRLRQDVPAVDFGTPYTSEDRWKLDTFSKESIAFLGQGAGRHRHVNTVRTLSNELNLNMKPNMENPQFQMDSVAGQKGQEWYLHNLKMRKKLKRIKRRMQKNYTTKTALTGMNYVMNLKDKVLNKGINSLDLFKSAAELKVEELEKIKTASTIHPTLFDSDLLSTYLAGGGQAHIVFNPELVFGEASLEPMPAIPVDLNQLSMEKMMKLWKMGYVELDDGLKTPTPAAITVETVRSPLNPYAEFLRVFVEVSVDCKTMEDKVKEYLKDIIGTKEDFACGAPKKDAATKVKLYDVMLLGENKKSRTLVWHSSPVRIECAMFVAH